MALKDIWGNECIHYKIPHNKADSTNVCYKNKCLEIFKEKYGELYVFEYDGCIIQGSSTSKCDYVAELFHKNRWIACYLIELKGNDIEEAINQIESSYKILKQHYGLNSKTTRIICTIVFSGHQRIPKGRSHQREFIDKEIKRRNLKIAKCLVKRNKEVIKINVSESKYY